MDARSSAGGGSSSPGLVDVEARVARQAVFEQLFGEVAEAPPVQRFGRHVVRRRLGAGGMGVVFVADDTELGRPVAIKLLHPDGSDVERRQVRLRREAEALARLSHPNVVQVYEVGEQDGQIYLAMELVDGVTLSQWQRQIPRRLGEILDVYRQVGLGLQAAHEAGLVHRDFKPDNVLVGRDGRPRVLDFGLVRVRAAPTDLSEASEAGGSSPPPSSGSLTATGSILGTIAYMSPEQLQQRAATAAADQFSFCVALYEAVYGHRPFAGNTAIEVATNVLEGRIRRPSLGRRVPAWLRRILLRGLSVQPERRFETMAALLKALDRGAARRRHKTTVATLLGLGLTGGALLSPADDRCSHAADRAGAVWSAANRDAVTTTFEAAAGELGTTSASRVRTRIDAWVAGWHDAKVQVCRAQAAAASTDPDEPGDPDPRGASSDEMHPDASAACLERSLSQLEALVSVWREADYDVVTSSITAANRLDPVEQCFEPVRAIAENEGDPRRAELENELARVRGLLDAGRFEDAAKRSAQVLAASAPTGLRDVEARAAFLTGATRQIAREDQAAIEHLQHAFFIASEIGLDETAAEAAIAMVALTGGDQARYDTAAKWYGHAAAAVERSGAQRPRLDYTWATILLRQGRNEEAWPLLERARADLGPAAVESGDVLAFDVLHAMGNARQAEGDLEEAVALLQEAVATAEEIVGPEHPDLAALLNSLGGTLSLANREREAIEQFDRSLELLQRQYGPQHPSIGAIEINYGEALADLGRVDEGLEHLQRAVDVSAATIGELHPQTGQAHAFLGNLLREQGRHDEAEAHLRRAVEIAEANPQNKPGLVIALLRLALNESDAGRWEEAEALQQRVLALRQEIHGPVHESVAGALLRLGIATGEQGKYERSRDYLEQAMAMYEDTRGADDRMVGETLYFQGVFAQSQDRLDEAEQYFLRALDVFERGGGPDDPGIARVCSIYGTLLSRQRRLADARATFERALRVFENTVGPDHVNVGFTLNNLGMSLRKEGRLRESIATHQRGLEIIEAALGPQHIDATHSMHNLGRAYAELGDLERADANLARAVKLRENGDIMPSLTADSQWALAKLRWKRNQHGSAHELAQRARANYVQAGESFQGDVSEIDTWLRSHTVAKP